MGVKIGSTAGYMYMDMWVLASIIQLGTFGFCRRFLNQKNDPCGRLFDQMTQAARSGQANLAEGVSRHQTSIETEMKLLDVARASINELSNYFSFILMANKQVAWRNNAPDAIRVRAVKPDSPHYGEDMLHDIKVGTSLQVRIPALGNELYPVEVTYIKAMGTYATWRSTRQNGGYDVRTFDVKCRPMAQIDGVRPGMTAIVMKEDLGIGD